MIYYQILTHLIQNKRSNNYTQKILYVHSSIIQIFNFQFIIILTMFNNQFTQYNTQFNKINFVYKTNDIKTLSPLKTYIKRQSFQNQIYQRNVSPIRKQTLVIHNMSPYRQNLQLPPKPSIIVQKQSNQILNNKKQIQTGKQNTKIENFSKYFPCAQIITSNAYQLKKDQKKIDHQKNTSQINHPLVNNNQNLPLSKQVISPKSKIAQKKKFQQQIKNTTQFKQSLEAQTLCINNDNKKAKYIIDGQPQNPYCSKCSIILVGKGFKMVQIVSPKLQLQKKDKQLRQFLSKISTIRQKIQYELDGIGKQKSEIIDNCKDQKTIIQKKYIQLKKLLKEYEERDLQKIEQYQKSCIQKFNFFQTNFKDAIQKIILMKKDIIPNIDVIKNRIDEQKYKQFMSDYQLQIKQIKQKLNNYVQLSFQNPPALVEKDFSKFSYDLISCLKSQQNLNSLFFSFQKLSQKQSKNRNINYQDNEQIDNQKSIDNIKKMNENLKEKPFRVLFNQQQYHKEENPSPNFKRF